VVDYNHRVWRRCPRTTRPHLIAGPDGCRRRVGPHAPPEAVGVGKWMDPRAESEVAWKARAGRRFWTASFGIGAWVSPWSCIRTLSRSSGWVAHPATIEAMPLSTKPFIPILNLKWFFSQETNKMNLLF
jgi:hypothetical protein